MLKFLFGFAVAVVVVLTAGFCYVRFGFVDPRADLPIIVRSGANRSSCARLTNQAPSRNLQNGLTL